MRVEEVVYVIAGIALPAYYVPQIRTSLRDRTGMAAYSMSKAATQLLLRVAMLPFVFGIGNVTMILIVSLDFLGRTAEFFTAVWSLRKQGFDGRQVLTRCLPLADVDAASPLMASPSPATAEVVPTASEPSLPELRLAADPSSPFIPAKDPS